MRVHYEMSSIELFFSLTGAHAQIILNIPEQVLKKIKSSLTALIHGIALHRLQVGTQVEKHLKAAISRKLGFTAYS